MGSSAGHFSHAGIFRFSILIFFPGQAAATSVEVQSQGFEVEDEG
jgi:hypothetical protein